MLDRMRGIRHACDVDLLPFFHRYPCEIARTVTGRRACMTKVA
jgi:hypothetical protein